MTRAESPRREFEPRRPRPFGVIPFLGLLLLASAAPSPATGREPVGNHGLVYVGSNSPNNVIGVFRRDVNGRLSPLGIVPTGGSGVHPTADLTPANLGPFDSDQCMIAHGRRLFYANGGSDSIAVFNIGNDGSLAPVKGSPFYSGGTNPASLGIAGDFLVVANKDYDLGRPGFDMHARQPNDTTFRVNIYGQLYPIRDAAVPSGLNPPPGAGPSTPTQVLVAPNNRLVFDVDFFGLTVRSFRLLANGRLAPTDATIILPTESPTPGNPFQKPIPLGLQTHPKAPILYVGCVLDQKIAIYQYDPRNGVLRFLRSLVGTGDALVGVCWLNTNKAGTRLYTAGNFNNTLTVTDISNPTEPVILQTVTLAQGPKNASPFQISLDPAERYLAVVTQRATAAQSDLTANSVQVLNIDGNGLLTLTDVAYLPTAPSRPQGVVAR